MENLDPIFIEKFKDKKPRILLYAHEFTYSGACISLLNICKVLKNLGCDITIWSRRDGESRIEYEKLGLAEEIKILDKTELKDPELESVILTYDLAICNTIVAAWAYEAVKDKIPVIWFIREGTSFLKFYEDKAIKAIFKCANEADLYTVSEYNANLLMSYTGKMFKVIHNFIPDSYDKINTNITDTNNVSFINLSRITGEKNLLTCLQAFNELPEDYKAKSKFYFAGKRAPGKDNVEYLKQIDIESAKSDNIIDLGELTDQDEKLFILKNCDVTVIASKDEACSLVALEGAMMAKPLLLTTNVGARYLLKCNSNGFVLDINNLKEELKKYFIWCIDNKDKLKEMGNISRQKYLKTSTEEVYVESLKTILTDKLELEDHYSLVETVIVSYNQEEYIGQAISSAIAQKGKFKHKILISDDCSTDKTRDIIKAYCQIYPDLVYDISPEEHLGIGGNYKWCRDHIDNEADFVAFLEGDDQWFVNRLSSCIPQFIIQQCAMVTNELFHFSVADNKIMDIQNDWLAEYINFNLITGYDDYLKTPINISSIILRANIFRNLANFMFEPVFSEITLYTYLLANHFTSNNVNKKLIFRNKLEQSITNNFKDLAYQLEWKNSLRGQIFKYIDTNIDGTFHQFDSLKFIWAFKKLNSIFADHNTEPAEFIEYNKLCFDPTTKGE